MAAYRRVYDSRLQQADCQEPGSAPEPYARQSSMGNLYLYLFARAKPTMHYKQYSPGGLPAGSMSLMAEKFKFL